jgi:cephalosporin hydroxylase
MTEHESFKAECNEEINRQNNSALWQKTHEWMFAGNMRHYTYHFEWLGRPILQYPQDIRLVR